METINTRFKLVRKTLGKNQTDFAKEIGLTQSSITMIERGERDVLERHVKSICSIFHVDENWLLTGEGEMFSKEKEKTDLMVWAEKLSEEGDTFAYRLAVCVSKLNQDQLDMLAEIAEKLVANDKKAERNQYECISDAPTNVSSGYEPVVESVLMVAEHGE